MKKISKVENKVSDITPLKNFREGTIKLSDNRLNAASQAIVQQLKAKADVEVELARDVKRISGSTRYSTAVKISKQGWTTAETVVIARGDDFPDALSVASYAARNGYPILLTNKDILPNETTEMLQGKTKTYVIGGEGVISKAVFNKIPGAQRISGTNRYGTGANLINTLQLNTDTVYVANGRGFADALTGSVLVAKKNASLLLVEKDRLPQETFQVIENKDVNHAIILGGTGAVNASLADLIASIPAK